MIELPRAAIVLAATLAWFGCRYATDPSTPPETETSCVDTTWVYDAKYNANVDILVVVDQSTAMSPYAAELAARLTELGNGMLESGADVHVGVVSADGRRMTSEPTVAGCAAPEDGFLIDGRLPWFTCSDNPWERCATRNFEGELGDALACIGALPVVESSGRPLLAAAVSALENPGASRFRRPTADALYVLFIAGADDTSLDSVSAYVDRLLAQVPYSEQLVIGLITPPGLERLTAVASQLRSLWEPVPISGSSWLPAVRWMSELNQDILAYSCIRYVDGAFFSAQATDMDLDNPGVQPDCVVTVASKFNRPDLPVGTIVPPCRMMTPSRPHPDNPIPCWRVEPDLELDCELRPITEGIRQTNWQCVSDCR